MEFVVLFHILAKHFFTFSLCSVQFLLLLLRSSNQFLYLVLYFYAALLFDYRFCCSGRTELSTSSTAIYGGKISHYNLFRFTESRYFLLFYCTLCGVGICC
jgi:hypothetical protein